MSQRYLVTGALPYSNGRLHVGHIAGAYLPADIYVRYRRAVGDDVLFVCGSDDNGVAITLSAKAEGLSPAEIVAKYNASQKRAFDGLSIDFDVYGGTHMPNYVQRHEQLSQAFFTEIHRKGYFTKRTSQQLYDVQARKFLPDRYVIGVCHHCGYDKAAGDQCESCGKSIDPLLLKNPRSVLTGTAPEVRETTHWYLRLADFQEPLKAWLKSKTDWRPTVLNFSLGQIEQGLPERAMTRDLDWGIPVPLDDPEAKGKVLYVWFDAPIGYVSFTSQCLFDRGGTPDDYQRWWKDPNAKIVHFIGEDNIIFHSLIWPAMLMAEGTFQLPHQVVANSFLNIRFPGAEEEKISKSRGTAVWIEDYLAMHGPDPLRYYLTSIAPEGARTAYDPHELLVKNDNELVATLGNLIHRVMTFAHKHFEGKTPPAGVRDRVDLEMLAARQEAAMLIASQLDGFHFRAGLSELMNFARRGNLYLDQKKPWTQRKTDMSACATSINVCLQVIKALGTLMAPFLPTSAAKVRQMLGDDRATTSWSSAHDDLPEGQSLREPSILFHKLLDTNAS